MSWKLPDSARPMPSHIAQRFLSFSPLPHGGRRSRPRAKVTERPCNPYLTGFERPIGGILGVRGKPL